MLSLLLGCCGKHHKNKIIVDMSGVCNAKLTINNGNKMRSSLFPPSVSLSSPCSGSSFVPEFAQNLVVHHLGIKECQDSSLLQQLLELPTNKFSSIAMHTAIRSWTACEQSTCKLASNVECSFCFQPKPVWSCRCMSTPSI